MAKNDNAQNMGGPSFNPSLDKNSSGQTPAEGTPSGKNDPKSEAIRKAEGNHENYTASDKNKKPT